MLKGNKNLRRICGWENKRRLPSESMFSRAFADFSQAELSKKAHAALIKNTLEDEVILHNSRDSTAIEAREKPKRKIKKEEQHDAQVDINTEKKRGRPKKKRNESSF